MIKLGLLLQPNSRGSRNGTTSSAHKAAYATDCGEPEGDASKEDQTETGDQADSAKSEGWIGTPEAKLR